MFSKKITSLFLLIGLIKLSTCQYGSIAGDSSRSYYQSDASYQQQTQQPYHYQQPQSVYGVPTQTQPLMQQHQQPLMQQPQTQQVYSYGAQPQIQVAQQQAQIESTQQQIQVPKPDYSNLQVQADQTQESAQQEIQRPTSQLQPISQSLLQQLIKQIPRLQILSPDLTSNIVKATLSDGRQAFVLLPSNVTFPIPRVRSNKATRVSNTTEELSTTEVSTTAVEETTVATTTAA
jgi:hypothetical protein